MQVLRHNKTTTSNYQIINEYLEAMKIEINLSLNYESIILSTLTKLSRFHKDKSFEKITDTDIITYLNSIRKPESVDPLHGWIGTYNLYLTTLCKFFKWLYNPDLEPKKRPKPAVVQNIPLLRRREVSIYKPTDLWTVADDLIFLKWCPNPRDRCYHAISRDLSARPHEILGLRIKDIIFKTAGSKQYAEVLVNGKTGTRHLPLIESLPYVKEWLEQHPQRNNPNAYFICSMDRKKVGKQLSRHGLLHIYTKRYRTIHFPKLLKDISVPIEDRNRIGELLKKPWNLYIRRHSALTQKSAILKEHTLRQHAGWSPKSQMHLKYLHYFGNESNNSLLQEYGILPKENKEADMLRPKQCPNCSEPNRPDSKFCAKCKIALTYDAYNEMIEEKQIKDKQIEEMMRKQEQFEQLIQSLIDTGQLKPSNNQHVS
jgi:integrase